MSRHESGRNCLGIILHQMPRSAKSLRPCMGTHRKIFVSAPSESSSTDTDVIPPAASRADAKNNILMEIGGGMFYY